MSTTATNFCFPTAVLANSKLKLVPFDLDRHVPRFFEYAGDPGLWTHVPAGPFTSLDDFRSFIERFCAPVGTLPYAALDLTRPVVDDGDGGEEKEEGAFAGMFAYMNSSPDNLRTELAVIVFPPFQRTHVTSNGVGLMLQHAFMPEADGGLGLNRVVWQTSTVNKGSARVAERMGFQHEGTLLYDQRYKHGKLHDKVGNGRPLPPGSDEHDLWRDTLVFGLCWHDWEEGARDKVQKAIDRTQ